jgi:metal-dependent amidase/aminoacylase/carboxypeptidase family protein
MAGSIMLIFQPAEERVLGARAMLKDGVFSPQKPVAIYGVHTAPLNVGQLGTRPGPMMAAIDQLRVTITGSGDLAKVADSARKLITAVSTITMQQALQGAAALTSDGLPVDALIANAITRPGENGAMGVFGSVSSASAEAREAARKRISTGLAGLGSSSVQVKVDWEERFSSGVQNDVPLMERANAAIRVAIGKEAAVTVPVAPPVFSEDYGFFTEQVPGVFWFLGVSNPAKGTVGMPHSPNYVADEGAILVAARAMTAVMLDRLSR